MGTEVAFRIIGVERESQADVATTPPPLPIKEYHEVLQQFKETRDAVRLAGFGPESSRSSLLEEHSAYLSDQVNHLARARGHIPKRVVHDRPCGKLCSHVATPAAANLADELLATITSRTKDHKERLEDLTLLVGTEFKYQDGTSKWRFAFIVTTIGQSTAAVRVRSHGWLSMREATGPRLQSFPTGAILHMCHHQHVEPKHKDKYAQDVTCGMWEHFLSDEYIAYLFDPPLGIESIKVSSYSFSWDDEDPEKLLIGDAQWEDRLPRVAVDADSDDGDIDWSSAVGSTAPLANLHAGDELCDVDDVLCAAPLQGGVDAHEDCQVPDNYMRARGIMSSE